MIPLDTWAVIGLDGENVLLECPFMPGGEPWSVPAEEIGYECKTGDILSTETGGWNALDAHELDDLTPEGREIFLSYIRKKGFRYTYLEKYGYIADQ